MLEKGRKRDFSELYEFARQNQADKVRLFPAVSAGVQIRVVPAEAIGRETEPGVTEAYIDSIMSQVFRAPGVVADRRRTPLTQD